MRTIPSALATHYAQRSTTLAVALKITRTDAQVYGFTSADADVTISAVLYKSAPGLLVTEIVNSAGYAVDNLELTTVNDGTVFTQFDILSRVWTNAAYQIFVYNWASPGDGIDTLSTGTLGEATVSDNQLTIELRGLQQPLQQPVGSPSTKTCRARLGDALCRKDLTSFTYTGTLTHVTSNQEFRDSARAEALAWFDDGLFTFTSGPNAGLQRKIKTHLANGTFTLSRPLLGTVAVGHTYSVIAGCRKRLAEDCVAKFNNVINFQGEPHRPTLDDLVAQPELDV